MPQISPSIATPSPVGTARPNIAFTSAAPSRVSQELDLERMRATRLEAESRTYAAVLELVSLVSSTTDLQTAGLTSVSTLAAHLGCERVALALVPPGGKRCRLQAISSASRFDRHSEFVRAIEAACDESRLRGSLAVWPATNEADRGSTLALQRLAALAECSVAISSPLCDERGEIVGVWVLLGTPESLAQPGTISFLRACQTPMGTCLRIWQNAERGPVTKFFRGLVSNRKSWQWKGAITGAVLLAGALALPLPYKVSCDCTLQPVLRRYVAAPFEGVLEKSLVAPGDLVKSGDVLARLEGREIRWELAGVTAEYNRAAKQSDAARAVGNVAAAQQARLEMERLDLKIRLLNDRSEHLEVKSPLDGIVVSGDLEKAEGAPLTVGQTMFEVAPLDRMLVELAVPEEDVAHVAVGAAVRVQLDAYGGERWRGQIERLHPRSEMRDERNVFIAELTFENPDGRLRPGLKGNAKITGPRRPLAWNLFHKAWERFLCTVGW